MRPYFTAFTDIFSRKSRIQCPWCLCTLAHLLLTRHPHLVLTSKKRQCLYCSVNRINEWGNSEMNGLASLDSGMCIICVCFSLCVYIIFVICAAVHRENIKTRIEWKKLARKKKVLSFTRITEELNEKNMHIYEICCMHEVKARTNNNNKKFRWKQNNKTTNRKLVKKKTTTTAAAAENLCRLSNAVYQRNARTQ